MDNDEPEPPTVQNGDAQPGARGRLDYLTPEELRVGGELKAVPEDFLVEEIPAYLPSGSGEHLYLWIEKRDVSAEFLIERLARTLGCQRGDIGTAGLKDRRAVTRQWLSVPAKFEEQLASVAIDGVRVLQAIRHGNKLRAGHLKGNQFEIRLRGIGLEQATAAAAIAEALRAQGVPNYYGDQRFGIEDQTLLLGLALLRGERSPRTIPFARRKFLMRLALSAVQSALFNDVLARRLEAGQFRRVLSGDVLQVVASGGCFLAEDTAVEQQRFESGEVVPTGPMFGPKMKSPVGSAFEAERAVLDAWDLTPESFERFPDLTSGTRRPLAVPAADLQVHQENDALLLKFELPPGAYATSVIREFQKGEAGN